MNFQSAVSNENKDKQWMSMLSPNIDFLEYYIENSFYLPDPHITHPMNLTDTNFHFFSTFEDPAYQENMLIPLHEKFSFEEGVCVVYKETTEENTYYLFNGLTRQNRYRLYNSFLNDQFLLKKLLGHFLEKTKKLWIELGMHAIDIATLKGKDFIKILY